MFISVKNQKPAERPVIDGWKMYTMSSEPGYYTTKVIHSEAVDHLIKIKYTCNQTRDTAFKVSSNPVAREAGHGWPLRTNGLSKLTKKCMTMYKVYIVISDNTCQNVMTTNSKQIADEKMENLEKAGYKTELKSIKLYDHNYR